MPKEYYFPDAKEPHVHVHKGGATFTDTRHKHKDLQSGDKISKPNCNAVIDDLKAGNEREKKIAEWIKKEFL
ncbi:MAG: hypothetical protein ABJA61_01345 [Caldimonas sp.]